VNKNMQLTSASSDPVTTVYFDGACPVCRREIAHYQSLVGGGARAWVDAANCPAEALGPGLDRSAALQRLHVRLPDGQLVHGADGFAALWRTLPNWAWLGRLAQARPVRPLLALAYEVFLRVRPLWRTAPPRQADASSLGESLPAVLRADLRSDHAGEVGAVSIYRGILAVSRDVELRAFALRHVATEAEHQRLIESWLPPGQRSRLLPAWRVAGWVTGALPALFGPRAVHATVAAVEQFVLHHYAAQLAWIDAAPAQPLLTQLRQDLAACQADEQAHRDEALALQGDPALPWVGRLWTTLVGQGSAFAVALARRF
jgi:ubiquinone biosynthesis monooxygenase Coq7